MPPSGGPPTTPGSAQMSAPRVLLLEENPALRRSLGQLLQTSGLEVSTTDRTDTALAEVSEHHYTVVLLDPDHGKPGEGLQLMSEIRRLSPGTAVVLLTRRTEFDLAVDVLRAGGADLLTKDPATVDQIPNRVAEACRQAHKAGQATTLCNELDDFLELFLKKLMETARKAQQYEEKDSGYSGRWDLTTCAVLVVDDNDNTAVGLQAALGETEAYRCLPALTGGEALDLAGRETFHIALVREALPDLPGSIVARSLRTHNTDAIVLLFTDRGHEPGRVSLVEGSKTSVLIPRLVEGHQLIAQIHELREAYVAKLREKRYLDNFRSEYFDFLAKYVTIKKKLASLKAD